eukprot:5703791-Amphidinium_carterae.1
MERGGVGLVLGRDVTDACWLSDAERGGYSLSHDECAGHMVCGTCSSGNVHGNPIRSGPFGRRGVRISRNGDSDICLSEGHRFFFALFFYKHWRTISTTADFGICVPAVCTEAAARENIVLRCVHQVKAAKNPQDCSSFDARTSL